VKKLRRALPLVAGAAIAVGSAVGAIGIAAADEAPSTYRAISMFDPEGAHGQCGEINKKCVGGFARDQATDGLPQVLPLTVSAWFKAPADGLDRPIAQHGARTVNIDGTDVTPRGWTLERRGADQKIGFALQSSDPGWYKKFELVTPPDQWVFVSVSVDATGAMVLHTWDSLNGWRSEAPTGKVTPYVPAAASGQEGYFSVGASKGAPNREFTGQIDDVRVYNTTRALEGPGGIKSDFQTTLAGTEPGLVGYWTFDNPTSDGTVVPDLSPNENVLKLDGPNGQFYFEGVGKRIGETPMMVAEYAAAPTVVSTSPSGGAGNVALSGPFTIDFSEPMEAVTVAGGISLAPAAGGPALPVTVATLDPTTFGVTPNAPLAQGTQYKLSVGAGAKDIQGTGATAHEVTFTTSGTSTTTTPTNTTPTTTTPTTTTPTTSTPTQTTQTTPTTRKPVVKPAYCKRYPKLRTTLARQLKAAKKARVKAVKADNAKATAKYAKRIKTIQKQQKAATKKFKVTCRIGSAASK
jgi:hypothetical protein